jgi:hypothetical protein
MSDRSLAAAPPLRNSQFFPTIFSVVISFFWRYKRMPFH